MLNAAFVLEGGNTRGFVRLMQNYSSACRTNGYMCNICFDTQELNGPTHIHTVYVRLKLLRINWCLLVRIHSSLVCTITRTYEPEINPVTIGVLALLQHFKKCFAILA